MKAPKLLLCGLAAGVALLAAGCNRHENAADGVIQTKFPGQVTAGGGSSGQVLARSPKPETNAAYSGGTPGIAGGSGGTTGGAALGGTVVESGHGPNQGATTPASAGQGGNRPQGDYGGPPANAPAAGVTDVGAGAATNQQKTAPAPNTGGATGQQQGGQRPASPPAAPGTLTGDK